MLVAKDREGRRTIGYKALRGQEYFCPCCGGKVVARLGTIRIPHFAHAAERSCAYYSGETELHRLMKKHLYDNYSRAPYVRGIELEFSLGDAVADVYLEDRNGKRIAIECQVSRIDERELMRRTVAYSRRGVHVLWILGGRAEIDGCIIRLRGTRRATLPYGASEIEKRLQRLYYGRFYYFCSERIYALHMEPMEKWTRDSCDGCPREMECTPEIRATCDAFAPGFMTRMRRKQQITMGDIRSYKPLCIERAGGLKLARFFDKRWWGKTVPGR